MTTSEASNSDGGQTVLTSREREILEVLATGASTDEVASQLRVSSDEVRAHVRNVMRTLHARSKLEALIIAIRAGLIREPGH